ncbi:hypothetical protein KY314_03355 [Candidatus Woesearchaeota archaeon]|nr:hypothetical protein [Candidatus Woesearchaeota archaeon]
MTDFKSVISHGTEKNYKWFVVSEGISKRTGKQKLRGQKVKVLNDNQYLCSCSIPPFTEQEEDCIHIRSLKHTEQEVLTKGKEIIPEKEKEIRKLKDKINSLETAKNNYQDSNNYLLEQINALKIEKQKAKESALKGIEEKIVNMQSKITSQKEEIEKINQEKDDFMLESMEKEQSLEQYNRMIKEELKKEKTKSYNANLIAESIKKANGSYSEEVSVLDKIDEDLIIERLYDVIYKNISDSGKKPKDKIKLGKVEHSKPKQFDSFVEKLANDKKIDEINCTSLATCKKTIIKDYYSPGSAMPNTLTANNWVIHLVYSKDNFASDLYLKTTAKDRLEAKVIGFCLEKNLKF